MREEELLLVRYGALKREIRECEQNLRELTIEKYECLDTFFKGTPQDHVPGKSGRKSDPVGQIVQKMSELYDVRMNHEADRLKELYAGAGFTRVRNGGEWSPNVKLPSAPGVYPLEVAPNQAAQLAGMTKEITAAQNTEPQEERKEEAKQNTGADAYAGAGFTKVEELPYQAELEQYIGTPHTSEETRKYAAIAGEEEAARLTEQFSTWADELAALMPQTEAEYETAVAAGKSKNEMYGELYEGYDFDSNLLQMIDYLYGAGYTDAAEQGKNLAVRMYAIEKDAESWNQYISDNSYGRASEFYQQKADEIKNAAGGTWFLSEEEKKEVEELESLAQQFKDAQYYFENDAKAKQVADEVAAMQAENPQKLAEILEAGRNSEVFDQLKNSVYALDTQEADLIDQQIYSLNEKIGTAAARDINFMQSEQAAKLYAELEALEQKRDALYGNTSYYSLLTEEEEAQLAYAAATMDEEEFEDYYEYLRRGLDGKAMEINLATNYEALGGDDPTAGEKVRAGIYSAITSVGKMAGFFETARQTVHNMLNPDDYAPVNTAAPAFMASRYSQQGRDMAVKDLPPQQAFLADVGISTLETLLTLPLGPAAAPVVSGLNAAGDASLSALEAGASPEQALAYAAVSGTVSMALERFGISGLFEGATLFRGMIQKAAGAGAKSI